MSLIVPHLVALCFEVSICLMIAAADMLAAFACCTNSIVNRDAWTKMMKHLVPRACWNEWAAGSFPATRKISNTMTETMTMTITL